MLPALKRLALGLTLITLASAVLLFWDSGSRRERRGPTIRLAIMQHASQHLIDEGVQGMIDGLGAAGFVDGSNLSIHRFNAEGDPATANAIAKQITSGGYDLILTATTLSLQAVAGANRETRVKHVFALVSDPFGSGVGISREHPLDHPPYMVGYGSLQPVEKSFHIARKLWPGLKRVGAAWNPSESNSEVNLRLAREACGKLGIELVETHVDNTAGVAEAVSSLTTRGIEALWVGGDVTVLTAIDAVVRVARAAHVPIFTVLPGNAQRGALFDVGADTREVGRLAGDLAGRVLHGTDPATIPVENVMPEILVVNRTALAGLKDPWTLPDDLVASSTIVIDEHGEHKKGQAVAAAPSPDRVFKIGVGYFAPDPGAENTLRGFFDGLRERGLVEGKNLEVHRVHAQGEIANIPAMMQALDGQGLDLIVPLTTPCLTGASAMVKNTPVVFTYVYDPIAAGAGKSFTDHLPGVTGVGSFPPVADTVAMIRQLVPGAHVVGTIYNASEANSRKVVEVARGAFSAAGIRLEEAAIANSSDVFQAAQALAARGVGAFWITGDNTALLGFEGIVKAANDAGLPIINNDPEFLDKGALACVGIGFYESGLAAAKMAARVLRGESPKDIPIENVAKKKVLVNLPVARRLGIAVPASVLAAADTVLDENGRHERRAAATAAPTPAALAKAWKLEVLEFVNVPDVEDAEHGIVTGLRDAGLVDGRDYKLRIRNAQGDMPTLSTMVDAAIGDGADMILTLSTPTLQAALRRAGGVPIVFTFLADAVAAGAAKSNEDHAANATGVTTGAAYEQLLDQIRAVLPSARRLGTLVAPAEVNSVWNTERLVEAAKRRGYQMDVVPVNTSAEVTDATLALLAKGIDAICQSPSNVTTAAIASIAQPAARAGTPLFGFLSGELKNGAAVVVARDYFEGGREAAGLAARIMRGENPARIPIVSLTKTRLLVNLASARALGIQIPAATVAHADQVIGQ